MGHKQTKMGEVFHKTKKPQTQETKEKPDDNQSASHTITPTKPILDPHLNKFIEMPFMNVSVVAESITVAIMYKDYTKAVLLLSQIGII